MKVYIFRFIIIILLFFVFNITISSQNLLKEGSFQTNDISWVCNEWPYIDFQIDYHFNYWESQYKNEAKYRRNKWQRYKYRDCKKKEYSDGNLGCNCCNYHSPDFEYDEPVNGYQNIYVGIGYCELIQQKLLSENNLVSGKHYKVSFKIMIPTKYQNGHNTITDQSELKFMLAKNKVKYKKPGFEYGKDPIDICSMYGYGVEPEGYNEYKLNGIENLKSYYLINYERDIWHNLSFVFEMPEEGINKHNWFVIDVAGIGYTYIDDITLEETDQCNSEDPCSPTDGKINASPPTKIYPDYKNYAVLNLDNVYSATNIEIFFNNAQLIDKISDIYCDNGIKKVEWDAEKTNVHVGHFIWKMTLTNDCGEENYTKPFVFNNPDNNPTLYPITNDCVTGINIPAPCCEAEQNIFIENETLEGSGEIYFHAVNNLTVRNTLIKSTAKDVVFKAGNQIILEEGFETEAGANVEMVIEPCDNTNKEKKDSIADKQMPQNIFRKDLSNNEQNEPNDFKKNNHKTIINIFPNPASNFTEITAILNNCSSYQSEIKISISDISGKMIYDKQFTITGNYFSTKINTSNFPSGIYFINFIGNNFSETEKLIVQ